MQIRLIPMRKATMRNQVVKKMQMNLKMVKHISMIMI